MTTDVITSLEELERLAVEWSALHADCPRATPFQSSQWLLPWTRHLFRGGDIWVLAFREEGKLVGLAPLFCWGTERKIVSFLGAGISDYGDLLFESGRERDCVMALRQFLEARKYRWDVLDLQEVRSGSELLLGQEAKECSICPVLDLSTYPESMDRKHRTDLRRAQNKLAKNFRVELAVANASNLTANMEQFIRLHELRWGPMETSLQRFHDEAAQGFLQAGLLRLSMLRVDDTPAASIYAFTTGRTLYCYLSGFEPAMAKLSPGAVLLAWTIENAMADGITEIDFLRETEAYKYLWGAKDRVNYKLT